MFLNFYSSTTQQSYQGSRLNIAGNAKISRDKLKVVGSQVSVGGNASLVVKDISIEVGQETRTQTSSRDSDSVSAGASTSGSWNAGASSNQTIGNDLVSFVPTKVSGGALSRK